MTRSSSVVDTSDTPEHKDSKADQRVNDDSKKTIKVFGNSARFGLPDVSPFVTKVIFFLEMTRTPYEYNNQDMSTIEDDAPCGKLRYVVDVDETKVGDSNAIIQYLHERHGITLDSHLSTTDRAVSLAFARLISENLYWSGVVGPRWVLSQGYKAYVPILLDGGELTPGMLAFCDDFRQCFVDQYTGHGMGRRREDDVLKLYKQDLDALCDFLGDKTSFMGDKVSRLDATAYSILRHCNDQPIDWNGAGYVTAIQNLKDYMSRMREEFDM